jgi:mRNA interferase RelE/StbE
MSGFNDVWRIRVGMFRIIYKIEDRRLIIEIVRVGHRRDVYRGL